MTGHSARTLSGSGSSPRDHRAVRTAPSSSPKGELSTDADNPFRGARVAPMGANIQWDLFTGGRTYLVWMRCDERETAFKPSCAP